MNWRNFDTCVYKKVCSLFPDAKILLNQKVTGQYSRANRHCDILVQKVDPSGSILIDAKYRYRRTDRQHIKEFVNLLRDVCCDAGILVAAKGYTEEALQEAQDCHSMFDMELITVEGLVGFQPTFNYRVSRHQSIEFRKPIGWVSETQLEPGGPVVCYPSRYTRTEAPSKLELLSVHSCYSSSNQSTEDVIEKQNYTLQNKYPGTVLLSYERVEALDKQITLCLVKIEMLNAFELTAYIPIGAMVVCLSMFSPAHKMLHLREKLINVVATSSLVTHSDTNTPSL